MHHSEKILTFALCWFAVCAHSQQRQTSFDVEARSFEYYTQSKWDQLISFSNKALADGYDYFYLRYRLGVAYYYKGRYRLAAAHFKKALYLNSDDADTQVYLYYSLLFSGRIDEARAFAAHSPNGAVNIPNVKQISPVNFVYAEGGAKIANNRAYGPAGYFQVNLSHTVRNNFGLLHAASAYNQAESRGVISQKQYFIQASVPLGKGWTFSPSLHSVNLTFSSPNAAGVFRYSDLVASGMVSKSTPYADFSGGGGYSTVLARPQYLQFVTVALYPRGKPDFSFGITLYTHQNNTQDAIVNAWSLPSYFAMSPYLYFTPVPRLLVGLNYFNNSNYNITEMNGYLVNNSIDLTLARYGGTIAYAISPRWDLTALYSYEEKQATTTQYSYSIFSFALKFKPL